MELLYTYISYKEIEDTSNSYYLVLSIPIYVIFFSKMIQCPGGIKLVIVCLVIIRGNLLLSFISILSIY